MNKVAPLPPPRPSKAAELVQRKFDMLKQDKSTTDLQTQTQTQTNNQLEPFNELNKTIAKVPVANDAQVIDVSRLQHIAMSTDEHTRAIQNSPKPMLSRYNNADINNEESELLTPNRTKTLTLKKKNSMLAKRRQICLKTLEFSDIQGHLFRRTKDKHGVTYWAKLYFVLVETTLYGFRNKKSQKADCLIFLPGFTISLAKEVHSKPHAYKVYHAKKTFYFAAESEQALSQWMDYIKRATFKGPAINVDPMLVDNKDLFSETDSSDDESRLTNEPMSFKHGILGGGKASKKRNPTDDSLQITQKNDKYHLGFGSLKKLTNLHSLHFSSNKNEKDKEERKKAMGDNIPVQPTPQFKSYRKIPGNAGMQLGSNSIDYPGLLQRSQQNQPQLKALPSPVIIEPIPTKSKDSNSLSEQKSIALAKTTIIEVDTPNVLSTITNTTESYHSTSPQSRPNEPQTVNKSISRNKTSPHNYMHASNPNLVEFTFQTSKTLDVGLPKVNVSNTFDQQLGGFITLKDLMLQQEEDEAHNMYNNRVNLGIEKPSDRHAKRRHRRPNEFPVTDYESENSPQCGQKTNVNKIQRRSLPKTPDYAQSFKADDTEIIMARSKEGQKLRDFGYEFISGDDMNNGKTEPYINNTDGIGNQNSCGMSLLNSSSIKNTMHAKPNDRLIAPSKRKGLNWIGLNLDNKRYDDEKNSAKGSFKFHPAPSSNNRSNSINFPSTNGERKRSSANSTFHLTKLTFPTNKTVKEKRLLGSPCLHRAASSIFGRKNVESPTMDNQISPALDNLSIIDYNSSAYSSVHGFTTQNTASPLQSANECKICTTENSSINEIGATDQNVIYPPVFVPETYSLRDPNALH